MAFTARRRRKPISGGWTPIPSPPCPRPRRARLRQRYPLPLASVPRELTDWALALARHWLYSRRPEGQDLPPAVVDAYRDALKALDAVRDGKMSLAVASEDVPAASEGARLHVVAPDRLFTADWLSSY